MPSKWISRFELKPGTWVFVPTVDSISIGRVLKAEVEKHWHPPKNYFHLHPGGHLAALRHHLQSTHFAHLDIQNFFGQVNKSRVTRCLKDYLGYDVARAYASQSTVKHPEDGVTMLPFGFVQSPLLASLALYKSALGRKLRQLPGQLGVKVSVYVDDIILSADNEASLLEALKLVEPVAVRSGFPLNKKKQQGPSVAVSAFNIHLANQSMLVQPERLRDFMDRYSESKNPMEQEGILAYVKSVNPKQAEDFAAVEIEESAAE